MLDATTCEYVASLVASGALVSLFRTGDGGALGCNVTLDGENEKEYFREPIPFSEWLRELDQVVTERVASHPSAKRGRKRP